MRQHLLHDISAIFSILAFVGDSKDGKTFQCKDEIQVETPTEQSVI